jgi:hypothetical protein
MIKVSILLSKRKLVISILILITLMVIAICLHRLKLSSIPPNLYIKTESSLNIKCIKGGYSWNCIGVTKVIDDLSPNQITYTDDNTIYVYSNQTLIFNNSSTFKMYNEDIKYYDEKLNETIVGIDIVPPTEDINSVSFNAPVKAGTYVYSITINYYDKGSVQYLIKVVVTQDISSLEKYTNTYIGDNSKVDAILNLLPFSSNKNGISLSTSKEPFGLTVKYLNINASLTELEFNTLAIFTLIKNVDNITYNIQNEEKIETFNITRNEVNQKFDLTIEGLKNYIR